MMEKYYRPTSQINNEGTITGNAIIVGVFAGFIATIITHQISIHGPEMSPGSQEWQKYHGKKAQEILAGEMGPADIITRVILGSEAYARDMQTEFGKEISKAEDRVPTPEELQTIANHHR